MIHTCILHFQSIRRYLQKIIDDKGSPSNQKVFPFEKFQRVCIKFLEPYMTSLQDPILIRVTCYVVLLLQNYKVQCVIIQWALS